MVSCILLFDDLVQWMSMNFSESSNADHISYLIQVADKLFFMEC